MKYLKKLIFIIILILLVYVILRFKLARSSKKLHSHLPKIVCIGDSNTSEYLSLGVSYTYIMNKKLKDQFNIINMGTCYNTSNNILDQMNNILSYKADLYIVLIGTNDVINYLYVQDKNEDNEVFNRSLSDFSENIIGIIRSLKSNTGSEIMLLTIPILGEDLYSNENKIVDAFNNIIKKYSINESIILVDINDAMKSYLKSRKNKLRRPLQYKNCQYALVISVLLHYIFSLDWDTISKIFNNKITTDSVHLNNTGAKIIYDEVMKVL